MTTKTCQIILRIVLVVQKFKILQGISISNFERTDSSLPSGYGELQTKIGLGSKLACASYCGRYGECERFLFHASTTDCMLVGVSSTVIPTSTLTSWLMFRPPSLCPSAFVDDTTIGMCYKVFSQETSWYNAQAACSNNGADLVTLDTSHKLEYFKGILDYSDYHIGAKKSGGDYVWSSTGDRVNDQLWGSNCPDNPSTELCVSLTTFTALDLNDIHCFNYNFRFICEIQLS